MLYGGLVREEAKLRFGGRVKMVPVYQPSNVDKDFRIRGFYEGRDYKDILRLQDDIPFLLKLYKEGKEDE